MNGANGFQPTLGGFAEFVANNMGVPNPPLGDAMTPTYEEWAFNYAIQWVNPALCDIPGITGAWTLNALAVYNLAADTLVNIAQDAADDPVYVPTIGDNPNGLKYWAWLRAKYGVLNFVAGVVQSSSDEGTSASYQVAKGFENYTISNLQNLKTPWGRAYLGIAQSFGPTVWGLS